MKFDINKIYIATNDTFDVENYVGWRVKNIAELDKKIPIEDLFNFMYYTTIYKNTWTLKGASEVKIIPVENKIFQLTAIKDNEILNQKFIAFQKN